MSQLVPCPGCARHIRLSASSCPFCDVAVDVASMSERYAPRRTVAASGAKRAVLFALGAGVAAACGGESEPAQPIYGAPVASSSEASSSSDPAPTTDSDPSDTSADKTSGPLAQPLYGAPITEDFPSDVTQPEYGAPTPPDAGDDFTDEPSSEPGDGGITADAGDAGASSDEPGQSSEPSAMPPYGTPPLADPRGR